jgi:hypothetical protein
LDNQHVTPSVYYYLGWQQLPTPVVVVVVGKLSGAGIFVRVLVARLLCLTY